MPQLHESSTQTQRTSACYADVVTHTLASYVLYQITSNHVNTDANNNNYSRLFETPPKNNHSSA